MDELCCAYNLPIFFCFVKPPPPQVQNHVLYMRLLAIVVKKKKRKRFWWVPCPETYPFLDIHILPLALLEKFTFTSFDFGQPSRITIIHSNRIRKTYEGRKMALVTKKGYCKSLYFRLFSKRKRRLKKEDFCPYRPALLKWNSPLNQPRSFNHSFSIHFFYLIQT